MLQTSRTQANVN